jgi:hypothetical protein
VTKTDSDQRADVDVAATMANLLASLSVDQIKSLTVKAIQEHRQALVKAETAYDAWKAAEANNHDAAELHENYTRLMLAARAQQMVLATLIDRLGYVPKVDAT